jgi:RNA polymerase sigma-70 factor (ECF subfamily)
LTDGFRLDRSTIRAGEPTPGRHPIDGPSPPETTDEQLLAQHCAGDADAFGEIVRRHRDRMWAVALRTLGDPDDAADAVQDAFVSAFRAAHSFRGDARVTTWLHRIVVNACIDLTRRRQARPVVPLPDDDAAPATADELTARDRAADVASALAGLPVDQAAALVLVDALGYPVEEAARILEAPTGTVKSRCARGRARLAVVLGHWDPGGNRPAAGAVGLTAIHSTTTKPSTPSGEEVPS